VAFGAQRGAVTVTDIAQEFNLHLLCNSEIRGRI
jgi:hypothetical protein